MGASSDEGVINVQRYRVFDKTGMPIHTISELEASEVYLISEGEPFQKQALSMGNSGAKSSIFGLKQHQHRGNSFSMQDDMRKNSTISTFDTQMGTDLNHQLSSSLVTYRLAFLGAQRVGKSSLITRYLFNSVRDDYVPTYEDQFT